MQILSSDFSYILPLVSFQIQCQGSVWADVSEIRIGGEGLRPISRAD